MRPISTGSANPVIRSARGLLAPVVALLACLGILAAAQAPTNNASASSNPEAVRKRLSYSPHELSFGRRATSGVAAVLVRNRGTVAVTFGKATVKGTGFGIGNNGCTDELAPGATCTVQVTFYPSRMTASARNAHRMVRGRLMLDDDAVDAPQTVTLTGDPRAPIAEPTPTPTPTPSASAIATPTPGATAVPGSQAGMVLIAGGVNGDPLNYQSYQSAELFDPVSQALAPVGNMVTPRTGHTATLLPNGKVLLEAGGGGSCTQPLSCANQHIDCEVTCQNTAELYDPSTSSFAATGSTEYAFVSQTVVLLGNGQVLVAGGQSWYCTADSPMGPCVTDLTTSIAELYDPLSGVFSPTGSMASRRNGHQAAPLPNGDAIEIGASPDSPGVNQSAEIYDLGSGTFSLTPGELIMGRVGSDSPFTATVLQTARIFIAGGQGSALGSGILAEVESHDPTTGQFTQTGSMKVSRSGHTATLLNDGRVLITGGVSNGFIEGNPSVIEQSAELYDPASGAFAATGNMNVARSQHTATLLGDGRVLIAGGLAPLNPLPTPVCPPPPSLAPCFQQLSAATASTEIYDPSTGDFTLTGDMMVARASHTATLLK